MGIGPKISPCEAGSASAPRLPNPNPRHYSIINIMRMGSFVVVRVKYHGCTNYEGVKVLVFEGKHFDYLKSCAITHPSERASKPLDPHFCDSKDHPSPVARFKPDREGMRMALAFCRSYRERKRK